MASLTADSARFGEEELIHISLAAPPCDPNSRLPCDILCVVDTSGSMQQEAEVYGANGDLESDGLSVLDIVRHAVRTMVEVLGPQDRLALVSYSDTAETALALRNMDEDGKVNSRNRLTDSLPIDSLLCPGSGTPAASGPSCKRPDQSLGRAVACAWAAAANPVLRGPGAEHCAPYRWPTKYSPSTAAP